jgi:hypothetical protein
MSIKVTGTIEVQNVFRSIDEFLGSKEPMEKFCEGIKERILQKTAEGKDYKSRKFKAYSKAYAKRKGTTHVDLKVTGKMLGALKSKATSPTQGRVWIEGESHGRICCDMLAQIHTTGTGKQPQREFMNISQTGVKELTKKHFNDPLLELARATRTWKK